MYYGALGADERPEHCPEELAVEDCAWFDRYMKTWQLFFDWGFSPPVTTGTESRRSMMTYPDCVTQKRHDKAVERSEKDPEHWAGDFYGEHLPEIAVAEMPICPEGESPRYVSESARDFRDLKTYGKLGSEGGTSWWLVGAVAVVGVGALIWFGGKRL